MSHTPHELQADFPEHAERITQLKASNSHFARLSDDYHQINRAVHRAETNVDPVDDATEQTMRKKRAALKDEIYRILVGT